jgi:hypothetical protein
MVKYYYYYNIILILITTHTITTSSDAFNKDETLMYDDIEAMYINDSLLMNSTRTSDVQFKSINHSDFVFQVALKQTTGDDVKQGNEKGLWVYMTTTANDVCYKDVNLNPHSNKDKYIPRYYGVGIKINTNSIIAIVNKDNASIKANEYNDITSTTTQGVVKYVKKIHLHQLKNKGIILRFTAYYNYIYVEVSYDNGHTFSLFFVEDMHYKQYTTFEVVSNLIGENTITYELSHVYNGKFLGVNNDNNVNSARGDMVPYEVVSSLNDVVSSLSTFDTVINEFNAFEFDAIVNETKAHVDKIRYINTIISNAFNNNTSTVNVSEHDVLKLMREITFQHGEMDYVNENIKNELVIAITQLSHKQNELNNTIYTLYDIVSNSLTDIHNTVEQLGQYRIIKSLLMIIIIISFVLLVVIYNNITTASTLSNHVPHVQSVFTKPKVNEETTQLI